MRVVCSFETVLVTTFRNYSCRGSSSMISFGGSVFQGSKFKVRRINNIGTFRAFANHNFMFSWPANFLVYISRWVDRECCRC